MQRAAFDLSTGMPTLASVTCQMTGPGMCSLVSTGPLSIQAWTAPGSGVWGQRHTLL